MQLSLSLNPVQKFVPVESDMSLDQPMLDRPMLNRPMVAGLTLQGPTADTNVSVFSELVIPSTSLLTADDTLASQIASQVTTLALEIAESPLRAIAQEFLATATQYVATQNLSSQLDTNTRTSETGSDPLAAGRAAFEEMERASILRSTVDSWSVVLGTQVSDSPAAQLPSTFEDEINAFLAA